MPNPKQKHRSKKNNSSRTNTIEFNSRNTKKETVKNKVENGTFTYSGTLTVGELAAKINITASDIIKKYFLKGVMLTMNSVLSDDIIGEVCLENGYDFAKHEEVSFDNIESLEIEDKAEDLVERAPVVTIMGHVDHGKTTLIDAIRSSHLVDGEVGGISQAIGAYQKTIEGKKITFIDTPGHEAFTAMRARGAGVTDVVVLVVAADDGVMPQTIEAIDHAKAAGVPIIIAINKMDKPGANPERVKSELMSYDIIPEEYGGTNICCEISAKKHEGIKELLGAIILQSEVLELKANPKRFALGTVLEAKLDKGEGPKASLLVQNGTLKTGDYLICGTTFGKIRRMTDDHGMIIKEALPSTPVSVIGLDEVPLAGDKFISLNDEKVAKQIANTRKMKKEMADRQTSIISTADQLFDKVTEEEEVKQVNIIIKADSTGSAEAIKASLEKIDTPSAKLNIIRATAGAITESDVLLATASNALIYGFNVRPDSVVRAKAIEEGVEIKLHRIIYALIEELEDLLKGYKKAVIVEQYQGQAEVRQVFKASKIGTVAGSYVVDGVITSTSLIRVLRNGTIVYEGKLGGLKRFKDEAKEVKTGFECGISIENFNDIHEGDLIEAYIMAEKKD